MKIGATLAILTLIATPALASVQYMNMRGAKGGNAADQAYMQSMQRMTKDMDVKPTGNADKDFVMMMTPHQGAIDMAKVELQYGKDPMLRKLASNIVKAQEKEIGEMKTWLAKFEVVSFLQGRSTGAQTSAEMAPDAVRADGLPISCVVFLPLRRSARAL